MGPAVPGDFRRRVVEVIARLQPGEVVSYGDVAAEAGFPGAARAVGAVLAHSEGLPWWRVVMADGRLAPVNRDRQAALLTDDGIAVRSGRVVKSRVVKGRVVKGRVVKGRVVKGGVTDFRRVHNGNP